MGFYTKQPDGTTRYWLSQSEAEGFRDKNAGTLLGRSDYNPSANGEVRLMNQRIDTIGCTKGCGGK